MTMAWDELRRRVEAVVEWHDYMVGNMASGAVVMGVYMSTLPCGDATVWEVFIGDGDTIALGEEEHHDDAKAAAIDAAVDHFAEVLRFFGVSVVEAER